MAAAEVHHTLRYVLANRAHRVDRTAKLDWALVQDERSSAVVIGAVSTATSWLLRVGWVQAAAPPE